MIYVKTGSIRCLGGNTSGKDKIIKDEIVSRLGVLWLYGTGDENNGTGNANTRTNAPKVHDSINCFGSARGYFLSFKSPTSHNPRITNKGLVVMMGFFFYFLLRLSCKLQLYLPIPHLALNPDQGMFLLSRPQPRDPHLQLMDTRPLHLVWLPHASRRRHLDRHSLQLPLRTLPFPPVPFAETVHGRRNNTHDERAAETKRHATNRRDQLVRCRLRFRCRLQRSRSP